MKNALLSFLIITFSFCSAQSGIKWQTPIQVSSSTNDNLHPRVVVNASGQPVIIWGKLSNNKVFFSRWNGISFTMAMTLNPASVPVFTASWAGPDIAAHGDTVYVVYKQTPEDTGHIYTMASYNGGVSFSSPVRVDFTADSISRFPCITTNINGSPLVAFMKFDPGFGRARYVVAKSDDYGMSYGNDVLASGYSGGNVCDCCPASIVCSDNTSVMMYRDNLNNVRNMWVGISADGGNSFPGSIEMDYSNWFINSCPSSGPDGVIIGDSLYMVYMSKASGKETVYFSKASLVTQQALTDLMVTGNVPGVMSQNFPRIANSGNAVAAVWRQGTMGDDQLALSFTTNITAGLPSIFDTVATGIILDADVAVFDTTVHVVWEDDNTGAVMYRRGTFTQDTTTITALSAVGKNMVQLFPSPAEDEFTIMWGNELNIKTLELFDVSGKFVSAKTPQIQTNEVIDVSALSPGIYILRITIAADYCLYRKVVVR